MGIENERIFFKSMITSITGDVLEIGSRDHGGEGRAVNFRDMCKDANSFVGVDIEPGDGVDIVWDFEKGCGEFEENKFHLGICCSVLEHVKSPWILAAHLSNVIRVGGALFVSVPWVWKYHPYPNDYWRISFSGVRALFPSFEFIYTAYATPINGEIIKVDSSDAKVLENNLAMYSKQINIERGAVVNRKYLPYLMAMLIGVKRHDQNMQAQE